MEQSNICKVEQCLEYLAETRHLTSGGRHWVGAIFEKPLPGIFQCVRKGEAEDIQFQVLALRGRFIHGRKEGENQPGHGA